MRRQDYEDARRMAGPHDALRILYVSVIADPDKLRQLASKLKNAGQQIEQLQRQALGALRSSGWKDREREHFEAELSRDLKAAAAIGQRLQNDYPKLLERKAKALDDFRR